MDLETKHVPVLLNEVITFLDPKPGDFIIDGTINGGGHAKEIINKIEPNGILLGVDLDKEAVQKTMKQLIARNKRLTAKFIQGNYADLPEILNENNLPRARGLLLDLGFSTNQIEKSGRGFSFLKNEVLDMRYDFSNDSRITSNESRMTGAEIVNFLSEAELARIFWEYGEERYSRRIAKEIVVSRKIKRIITTDDLSAAIRRAVPRNYEYGRINPSTRVFQALRIYVNHELDNLERVLSKITEIVSKKGRVVAISFHSLEDRLVKRRFKELEKEGKAKRLTKKPVQATGDEMAKNPKSRSAKLRAIEMA